MTETQTKIAKIVPVLEAASADAAVFWTRANFAWITGGRDNHVGRANPVGVAGIVVAKSGKATCITSTIEGPRYREEALAGLGIDVVEVPWWDIESAKRIARDVIGDPSRTVADFDQYGLGWKPIPAELLKLRQTLTPDEIARYRTGATIARDAIEAVARETKPGLTERELAGRLDYECRRRGGHALTILIAVDERLWKYRHPIPTDRAMKQVAMLVVGCEHAGLITSVTRFIHAGPISSDLQRRVQAVADIDAAAILGTWPGRKLKEVFADIQAAYARTGFDDEWKNHHQGGATGYAPREQLANPSVERVVELNQAFAWNPSIPGYKGEDTTLLTEAGVEVMTAHTKLFPTVIGRAGDRTLPRAGVLEV
ncbi:MAG: M24 family metallopeptidase [Tepidisphaeraceae bacterium]